MAHYSINNIIRENSINKESLIKSTPERKLPIFITKNQLADKKKKYDTIIVGAGVAGLYAAYKIAKNISKQIKIKEIERSRAKKKVEIKKLDKELEILKSSKILIVEQSKRTGGRLDTDLFLIDKNLIKEEEGGMRFTFEDMPQLMNLFVELGLDKDIVPFPMHLDDNNRRSFKGRTFSAKEGGRNNYQVWSDLYGLKNVEKGINPSSIIPDLVYPNIIKSEYQNDKKIEDRENYSAYVVLQILKFHHERYLQGSGTLTELDFNPEKIYQVDTCRSLKAEEYFNELLKEVNSSKSIGSVKDDFFTKQILKDLFQIINKVEISAPAIWQFFRLAFNWKEIPLYKWTLWSLLADMGYSNECIQMMARVSGFNGTYFSTMNAGEAFQLLMEFPAEPDFKSLRYGFSQLTNALVDKLVEAGNVSIVLNAMVSEIHHTKRKFPLGKKYIDELHISSEGEMLTLPYTKIILALPRVALEKLINASGLNVGKDEMTLWNNLEATTNQPLAKINLYYDNAWWNSDLTPNADVTFGPNFTDIPLGSVYPFYSDDDLVGEISAKLQALRVKMAGDGYKKCEGDLELLSKLERILNERLSGRKLNSFKVKINDAEIKAKDITLTDFIYLYIIAKYNSTKEDDLIIKLKKILFENDKELLTDEDYNSLRLVYAERKEIFDNLFESIYDKPAALTVYCDYQNINFWQGFAKTLTKTNAYPQDKKVDQLKEVKFKDKHEKVLDLDVKYLIDIKEDNITPASNEMVAAITEYFQQLFQTNKVPKPIATSVRIWEGSQSLKTDAYGNFGYGVHQWGVGAKDDKVIDQMVKPFADLKIYTCGEAYSDFQGWVEGSLRSTNLALNKFSEDNGLKPAIDTSVDPVKNLKIMRDKYDQKYKL